MHRFSAKVLRRAIAVPRNWFQFALTALALSYAAECITRNQPYWEPDVAYLHWSTDVPAVTVCQTGVMASHDHYHQSAKSTLKDSEIDDPLSVNILKQTYNFKRKDSTTLCNKIFKKCLWNGKHFNCCRHFQPHRFVIQKPCFSINSLQTVNRMKKLIVSHFSKKGELIVELNKPIEISLHSPADVSFGDLQKQFLTVNQNEEFELLYTTRQIIEDVMSLTTLNLATRGCLLHDERKLFHHSVYSKSACLLECFLRNPEIYAKNYTLCDCLPTCAAMEINNVWNGTQKSNDNSTRCVLTISTPATERLVMKAKKTYVDLIVMVACLLQLFTGINLWDILNFILNSKRHNELFIKN